jgi:hypothetical protein
MNKKRLIEEIIIPVLYIGLSLILIAPANIVISIPYRILVSLLPTFPTLPISLFIRIFAFGLSLIVSRRLVKDTYEFLNSKKKMQQPTEQNTRQPTEVKIISLLYIYLSICWLIIFLLFLFVLYMGQVWADVEIIPFPFPLIIFIILIIVVLLGKINFDFLRLKKWALFAIFILQFIYIIGSVRASIDIGIPFIQIVSSVNIGMSALILNYLNKSSVKQAFGL